jgi:hypothetical protein
MLHAMRVDREGRGLPVLAFSQLSLAQNAKMAHFDPFTANTYM